MARQIGIDTIIATRAESLKRLSAEWNGRPRLDSAYQLPWPKYTRHDWFLLYTHFVYYPFDNVRQFAEVYGLNYNSSQTWIQIGKVFHGNWAGNKRVWLMDVVRSGNKDIIKALRNPDKHVTPYKPLTSPRKCNKLQQIEIATNALNP